MRLALVQVRVDAQSRSNSLQGILGAIRAAVAVQPAPDLIVLPGSCDAAGLSPDGIGSPAFIRGMREAIALEAKDWGIYIAVGLHRKLMGAWVPDAVLLDADGDVVAAAMEVGSEPEPVSKQSPGGTATLQESRVGVWPSILGAIGIMNERMLLERMDVSDWFPRGGLLVVPMSSRSCKEIPLDAAQAVAERMPGLTIAVVAPTRSGDATSRPHTFVVGTDGQPIAQIEPHREHTLFLELQVEQAPADWTPPVFTGMTGDSHAG